MKNFIPTSTKSKPIQKIINEALDILESIGIPLEGKKKRGLEKMAMSFLALVNVTNDWQKAKCEEDGYGLTSKEVIKFFNEKFEDNISVGSYDDVPRDYIKLLVAAGFVSKSGINPKANYNSPQRKYTVPKYIKDLIVSYNTFEWPNRLKAFNEGKILLKDELLRKRNLELLPVILPGGDYIHFHPGSHNELQKQIIEGFLTRFGSNCKVLYVGDGSNKSLKKDTVKLKELNFFDISHGMLPDIVAYSKTKNRLYLIEAFYSTGTIDELRMKELKKNLVACSADVIYVTAFLTLDEFKKQALYIAWESEVWIAERPDHLIHFNGHKFLGAY